ncbi:thiamine diphosphokinase [Faecalicatena contorta]|uniref:thiamine diphosphokinase n=1 Tax=Faecalicatena contorta TaxID=39482 RepID=UPI00196155F4|nr:thiamine diphosphokinase [Faecalicatena contorta]MBM6686412.1 thiamine diphosphokinase [Faecalicatena contorta]MBM6711768.1 thiamine diphosphokinase [Faecalicatena contorta]
MSKRAVIISGGTLYEELIEKTIGECEDPCIIGVDKGVEFLYRHNIKPSYIVGDFDSLSHEIVDYYKNETHVSVREFNPVKDASDTEIAVRLAITLGCHEMVILGATGSRVDHLWANIQTLTIPFKAGVDAVILDPQNRIRLIGGETHLKKEEAFGDYFSVFPLGEVVYGFNIRGAKYPLTEHTLTPYDSLCVSNQIEEDEVVIDFVSGIVILMETRDREEKQK